MVYASLQVFWICLALFAQSAQSASVIHLFPGGIISEEVIKSNLINAYQRYFSGKAAGSVSMYIDGILSISGAADIIEQINDLDLKRPRGASCVHWYMDKLVPGSDNYIVTDLNPCNGTFVVSDAKRFLRNHFRDSSIVSIGMGNQIHSDWLQRTCGPCSSSLGCLRGWNWFRV